MQPDEEKRTNKMEPTLFVSTGGICASTIVYPPSLVASSSSKHSKQLRHCTIPFRYKFLMIGCQVRKYYDDNKRLVVIMYGYVALNNPVLLSCTVWHFLIDFCLLRIEE